MLAVARALAVDLVAGEVVAAFRTEGIDAILLKGATLAEWLYADDIRPYGDADLLVEPARVCDAATVLTRLGFEPVPHHVSLHAHPWIRTADRAEVDLHVRLYGLDYPPERVWAELQGWLQTIELGPSSVTCLGLPGRALQVTLHAAQHEELDKPREDLRRALAVTPDSVWREAERLADRTGGLVTMGAGLAQEPAGERLLGRLALVRAARIADPVRAPLAIGFARFSQARGPREKLHVLISSLTRPPEDLGRDPGTLAAGRLGRPALRAWHILTLIVRAPRTIWALRRHRP